MADWRGKGSDRPAPKKPTPLPVVPRPAPNPVAHEAKPSGGAKGSWKKKSPRVERASHSTPAWRRTSAASEGTGALKRVTRLASVGVLATASFLLFAWYVFSRTYVIPVFVSVSTSPSERISALGEFSYPQATENRINANQETIRRFRLTRESNESDLLIRAIAGSENWTADLSKKGDRDLTSKFLGDSNRLIGGGQGRRLVVFYFQGTIARNQNSSWELLFSDANPFSLKGPQNGVALGQLFDRVGTALARDAFALIILDVSPPSVVTNLGDLEFPAADIQAEFDKLQANRERMAIFLPCNQSEENLVAPELASSVFGHFALEGLETGFGDRTMTLDAYVQQVRKRVSSWSGQYRLAKQEPILITAESTERLLKDLHFYGLFSRLPKATSAAASTNYLERASELDRFWEQWTMLRGYYAIDPILYKSIEAQLVVLENVAESSGDSWGSRINKLERDLESVRKRWRVDRRVSLIESVFDQRIGRSNLFSSDVILPSQARPTATGSTYSRDDLGWILWSKWSTAAKSKDTTEWKKTFDWEVMAKELNTLGKPINNLEWLELQVCRILHEETIDQTDDSVRAMASLIAAFSTLQETVCTSGTPPQRILKDKTFLGSNTPWERIPWIHSEVLAAESEFLQAFDAYCVGNFTDAFQRCDNLLHKDGKLTKLKEKADTIDQAIEMRDRVLAESPHLLAFLLRECPYTEIAQSLIEQVAISVDRAKRLELLLDRSKNQDWMALSSVPDWDSLLEDAFDLQHLREGAASDPESIRVYRAAIRCPLTPPAVRQSLRERYADYLRSSRGKTDLSSAPEKSIDVPTKGSQTELKLAYSNQLEELNTPDRELLKMQLSTGLRHLAPEEADQQKDTNLYAQSRRIRFFASDLAVNPSLVLTDRPWNSPTAFMASCERDYRELQIRRFYSSRWGAGDLTVGPEKLYFRQCAQSYFSAAEDLRGFHESQVAPQLESELWENAKRDFSSFTFQSDLTDNQRELRIFSESAPTHWDKAIGSARLQPTSTSRPSSLVAAVALNTSGPLNALLPIPAGTNQLPNSFRFAIRGHSLHTPLAPPLESTRWSTSFQADKELASIRVTAKAEPQTVLILLDCSNSMNRNVPGLGRTCFDEARSSISILLDLLEELADNGIASEVCFMPFGLDHQKAEELPEEFQFAKLKTLDLASIPTSRTAVLRTETEPVNSSTIAKLRDLVYSKDVYATGETPLYNAVAAAIEMLSNKSKKKKLIILSDGANEVTGVENEARLEDIEKAISAIDDLSIYVFQINNPDSHVRSSLNPTEQEALRQRLANENAKFFAFVDRMSGIGRSQKPFSDFTALQSAIRESFSLPPIRLSYDRDPTVSTTLEFSKRSQGLQAGNWTVSIDRSRSPSANDETPKAQLELRGNERLNLEYDEKRFTLRVMPEPPFQPKEVELQAEEQASIGNDRWYLDLSIGSERSELHIQRQVTSLAGKPHIRRPAFAVATMQGLDSESTRIVLPDVSFAPTYPPELVFSIDRSKIRNQGRFDLWYSDYAPEMFAKPIMAKKGLTTTVEGLGMVEWPAESNSITVRLRLPEESRYFVLCPGSSENRRDYILQSKDRLREEIHRFTLDTTDSERPLFILSDRDLSDACKSPKPLVFHVNSIFRISN